MSPRLERRPTVAELLDSFGRPDAAPILDAFSAGGPGVIGQLFRALLDPPASPRSARRDGRAVLEDEDACLHRLATMHPRAFVARIHAHPAVAGRSSVLTALTCVPGPEADALLLAGLNHRRGWHRWIALRGLLARDCDRIAPRLPALLRDRDVTVRFAALDGLRRWGAPADLAALRRYIDTAPRGGVEFALDAIEAICTRAGHPLPPHHPGPRLELLTHGGTDIELRVIVASQVAAGELLAHIDGQPLHAPCAGIIAALDPSPGRLLITIRRAP